MRDLVVFLVVGAIALAAVVVGSMQGTPERDQVSRRTAPTIPSIGKIQILNGCGVVDAAGRMADFLREQGFDVKSNGIGNAATFNYSQTLVVSRTSDMAIARQVGHALKIPPDRVILARQKQEQGFDATVFVGSDIGEILR